MNMMFIMLYRNIKIMIILQLLISSYIAGNKSKDLYNKINEMLYNNYKNNKISKKEYQNIINKI